MAEQQRNPFRGFLDMASEMQRIRSAGIYGQEGGAVSPEPRRIQVRSRAG